MSKHEEHNDEPASPADAPTYGGGERERDALRDRCRVDRCDMTARETADCAGSALEERYENEEDGGS